MIEKVEVGNFHNLAVVIVDQKDSYQNWEQVATVVEKEEEDSYRTVEVVEDNFHIVEVEEGSFLVEDSHLVVVVEEEEGSYRIEMGKGN